MVALRTIFANAKTKAIDLNCCSLVQELGGMKKNELLKTKKKRKTFQTSFFFFHPLETFQKFLFKKKFRVSVLGTL